MKAIPFPREKPAPGRSVGDPHEARTAPGEDLELPDSGDRPGEAPGVVRGHDEDVDERKQLEVFRLEALGTAIEGNKSPALTDETSGVEAGRPMTSVEV